MSDLLSSIGGWLSSPAAKGLGGIAGLAGTGLGLAGNLQTDAERAAAAKQAEQNAKLTPQQLAAMVSGAQQPLDRSLVQAVTQNVNAGLAEQGLSEAPGLIAQATSQGLAPYEQANQQAALQLVMRKLGLPAEFASTIPPNADMSKLLALLMKGFNIPGTPPVTPAGGITTGPNPDPSWNLGDWNPGSDTTGISV